MRDMFWVLIMFGALASIGLIMLGVWRVFGHLLEPLLDYVYGH